MNRREKHRSLVRAIYKNRFGEPFILSDGQCDIFESIVNRDIERVVIRAITQYGKSEVASIGLLEVLTSRREKILIIAPKKEQADIIMGNIISHVFDHEYLVGMIQYEGSLERLKNERSKNRVTFKNGSEVFVLTANVDEVNKEGKTIMGFGATIVLVDESSLIPDVIFSKILRMIGGFERGKMIQLGNPFERNHFYSAFFQKRYHKIIIKKEQALREGRISQKFLDEAKESMPPMDFYIFYECEFPEGGASDTLIPWDWLEIAVNQDISVDDESVGQAGLDVARFGRDKCMYYFRKGGRVLRREETQKMDTMEVVGWVSKFIEEDSPETTVVDVIGIGSGVYDRLNEKGYSVYPMNVGEKPSDSLESDRFFNLRAEIFWNLRSWFEVKDGKSQISIFDDPELKRELQELRYRYSSERKIRIEEKEKMKERIGRSPDHADALALAFAPIDNVGMEVL